MSLAKGDDTASPAVLAETGTVVLVRYRRGVVGETLRTVHVVSLPAGGLTEVIGARCGVVLILGDLEMVAPGEGMPCLACVLRCATDAAVAEPPPNGGPDGVDTLGPAPGGITYQQWGWPVTLHHDQVRLQLDGAVRHATCLSYRWKSPVQR